MRRWTRPSLLLPVLLLLLPLLPKAAAAQAKEEGPAEGRGRNTRMIEEVIVSATKRAASVREVPISIDAFTGDQLEELGATNMEGFVNHSPSVTLQKGEGADNNRVTIRGIGGNSFFTNRTFGVFIDDVSLVNPSVLGIVPDIDPFDMASVEVLKGPQGTLFGGSALAGAIRYVPARPDFEDTYGNIGFGVGKMESSDETLEQYTAMINFGGNDHVALRLAGSVRKYPGYVDDLRFEKDNDINATDIDTSRALLDWRILDYLTLQLTHIRRDAVTEQFGYVDNLEHRRDNRSKTADESGSSSLELSYATLHFSYFESFDINLTLAKLKKSSVQNYDYTSNFNLQGSGTRARIENGLTGTDQPSAELRMVSKDLTDSDFWLLRNWQFLVGIYKQESEQFNAFPTYIAEPDPNASGDDNQPLPIPLPLSSSLFISGDAFGDAEEEAAYFDLTRDLFDGRLQLGLGGRFYSQSTDFRNENLATVIITDGVESEPQPLEGTSAELDESGFTPKASVTWFFNDDLQVYASAVKGFRYGGGNFTLPDAITGESPSTFESDELWNYELGLRSEWLDRTLQADFAVFRIDWDDTQVNQITTGGLIGFNYIDNIGAARATGAELKLRAGLPYGFSLLLNTGYVHAEVTEPFESPRGSVAEGTSMPTSPSWTASAILTHQLSLGAWDISSNLSWSYTDDSKHDYINPIELDEHRILSVFLGIANATLPGRPRLDLGATNVKDESAVLGTYNASTGMDPESGNVKTVLLSPRTLTANLRFHF